MFEYLLDSIEITPTEVGEIIRLKTAAQTVFPRTFSARVHEIKGDEYKANYHKWSDYLSNFTEDMGSFPLAKKIKNTLEGGDAAKYEDLYEQLIDLTNKKKIYTRRSELLSKLRNVAPTWAESIKGRVGIHGSRSCPEDLETAWKVKQWQQILDARHSMDLQSVQKSLQSEKIELHGVTASLVEN